MQLSLPTIVPKFVAPFPGSSHLPTLAFCSVLELEEIKVVCLPTENPQGHAVFLQKKVEHKHPTGEQNRGSSNWGHLTRSLGAGGILKSGRQGPCKLWLEPSMAQRPPFLSFLKPNVCTHSHTRAHMCVLTPRWNLLNAACICRILSSFTNCLLKPVWPLPKSFQEWVVYHV